MIRKYTPFVLATFWLLAVNTTSAGSLERLFAPKAELWSDWLQSDAYSSRTIDHQAWGNFLKKYVTRDEDGITRLPYAGIIQVDRQVLKEYIIYLQTISISNYKRTEQLAYWINLYNAVTVDLVMQHYPVDSIRDIDISPGLFSDGPWGKKLLTIENRNVSLNDIEHRILRPIWKEPRLHYALNCASIGCPNLNVSAFTAANTDKLLEQGAFDYINHPRGVSVKNGELYVSSIYSWFQEDFGDNELAVIRHLIHYAAPKLAESLRDRESIDGDDYNWMLNDLHPAKPDASQGDDAESRPD